MSQERIQSLERFEEVFAAQAIALAHHHRQQSDDKACLQKDKKRQREDEGAV